MKHAILAFALVLAVTAAQAATFTGNVSPTADCFVPASESYVLTNDTSAEQTYTITSVGEQKEWINLDGHWIHENPLRVTLAANQSKQLFAFLKPQNCYVAPGTYPITVQAAGITQTINLNVVPIRTLNLSVSPKNASANQCGETTYAISLENTGKSDELVQLRVDGIPVEWTSFSQRQFVLEKGRNRELNLRVSPACTAPAGKHEFLLQAFLANTSFFTSVQQGITITQVQGISAAGLEAGGVLACADEETRKTVTLKNNGQFAETLQVSLSGPDWITLDAESLALAPGEEKATTMNFEQTTAEPGQYVFTLRAYSEKFNQTYEFAGNVELQDCYGSSLGAITMNTQPYQAGMEVCLEDAVQVETTVHNPQAKPIALSLSVENGTVNPGTLALQPQETKGVQATVSFAGQEAGEKKFSLDFSAPQFSGTQEFDVNAVDCYSLSVDYTEVEGRRDVNAEAQEAYTVLLKNTGRKELLVKADVNGPAFVYFQPSERVLQPGQQEGIFLYISPPFDTPEGSQKAILRVNAKGFSETKEITFNVYGGLYALIGEARLSTNSKITGQSALTERTVNLLVTLTNDGNTLIRVTGVQAIGYAASANFSETTLQPGQHTQFPVTLSLEKGFAKEQFVVPLSFQTDKGAIVKSIGVDLKQPVSTVGFFALGDVRDAAIILLALVIVVLIVIVALRTRQNDGKSVGASPPVEEKKGKKK